jgi:hypothetical protein
MPGYYRPQEVELDAEEPCLKCDCDLPGTSKTCIQEGEFAGKCNCLLGYEGDKCEFCARGFKGWPKCEPCPCDSRGVLEMADCEGDCTCKVRICQSSSGPPQAGGRFVKCTKSAVTRRRQIKLKKVFSSFLTAAIPNCPFSFDLSLVSKQKIMKEKDVTQRRP